jgi:phosphatidylglycerol lysyltransferase
VVALGHAVFGQPWYTVLTPASSLGLLLLFRNRFTVHSEARSVLRGFGVVVASVALILAYGTAGFWLLDVKDFGIDFTLANSFVRTLREYALIGNDDLIPRTLQADWFMSSLDLAGLIVAAFAAYSLFRPVAYQLRTLPHERQEAKSILEKYGTSSQDFFKLWPDKSYFFSADRESFIAYKVSANVAVALGDPVGPEQGLEAIIEAFVRYCSDNGWGVAFYRVLPELLPIYHRLGMQNTKIGEEAMIDLGQFCSQTARRKKYRWLKRKFEREGYFLTKHDPPHPQDLLDELEEVSEEWLSLPGRRERGFTLGSFDRDYLNKTRLFVLRDAEKYPLAFVNEILSYKEGETALDLMRYRLEIPNATMDYLLIELLLYLNEEGFHTFDLGLAPLAGVGDRPEATLEEQALSRLYKHRNPFFSYKGLRDYKAKFEPNWVDRFLTYKGGLPGLAKVGLALKRATEE